MASFPSSLAAVYAPRWRIDIDCIVLPLEPDSSRGECVLVRERAGGPSVSY